MASPTPPPPSLRQAAAAARRQADALVALGQLARLADQAPPADPVQARAWWAEVATQAGALQRRSRQLAGLGRGG